MKASSDTIGYQSILFSLPGNVDCKQQKLAIEVENLKLDGNDKLSLLDVCVFLFLYNDIWSCMKPLLTFNNSNNLNVISNV